MLTKQNTKSAEKKTIEKCKHLGTRIGREEVFIARKCAVLEAIKAWKQP